MKTKAAMINERYTNAMSHKYMWGTILQRAYDFTMPNRNQFNHIKYTPGQSRTEWQYDSTATIGLRKFASNLQQLMMPAGQHWLKLSPGKAITSGKANESPHQAEQDCQKWEDLYFDMLDRSNFQQALYQSLMEMGISTGVMLITEGTIDNPFVFTSVPLDQVCLEAGAHQSVQNVYRYFKVPLEAIQGTWPRAELTPELERAMPEDPQRKVEIIEGTIYEPDAEGEDKWCYFVMQKGSDKFLLQEYMSWSPWLVFRWNLDADEVYGRGPVIDVLPFIQALNKLAENDLRAASYNANPIFLVASGSEINPYTARIDPGCIIPVMPNGISNPPVQQLVIQGQPNYAQLTRQELVEGVNGALNVNPIVPADQGNKTATEISARQEEWMRSNQAQAGRYEQEISAPMFNITWHILGALGLVPKIKPDGKIMDVDYNAPIKDLQGRIEVQKAIEASQMINQILGPQYGEYGVLLSMDVTEVGSVVCDKLGVNVDFVRDALSKQKFLQGAAQAQAAQQQQGAPAQPPMPQGQAAPQTLNAPQQ
jgi:hypothetical protein